MMDLTENEKAVLLLASRVADSRARALAAGEWAGFQRRLADSSVMPADLWDPDVVAGLGLDHETRARVAELLGRAPGLAFELDRLASLGIWALTDQSDDYPEQLQTRLGSQAPPVLMGAGLRTLLNEPGLAIVGSRNVDPAGAEVAGAAARLGVRNGLPVVSGGARGVDQLAMASAFEAGGRVIGVLADALERKVKQADIRSALLEDRLCLVTAQHPAAGFSVGAAMGRNKIIYSLSRFALVVASDRESGGTWNGAVEAIKKNQSEVLIWTGEGHGPGNDALVGAGGTAVPTLERLEKVLTSPVTMALSPADDPLMEQLDFFA